MNLFLATRSLTDAKEDHLTEFVAAALELSPPTRAAFYDLVLARFAEAKGWGRCTITSIETQPCYDDASCRPDMLLTLDNGKLIACEHKLEAAETVGPASDERAQLERYLDLPVDGLVYIRSSWKPPERHILAHPKYVRPERGEHFLWRDFYPLFEFAEDRFLLWLKEGFERLGFTPPHPQVGKLGSESERRNFAKLWSKTRSVAHGLGWESSAGSIVQLYLEGNRDATAAWVFVQPVDGGFQLRVTPRKSKREAAFAALAAACKGCGYPLDHGVKFVPRKAGKVAVYDIVASASHVLGRGGQPPAETEDRLCQFVSHFLRAVQSKVTPIGAS